MSGLVHGGLFDNPREPEKILAEAIEKHNPSHVFVGFSGGNDSLAVAHWMMNNVPGCVAFHANTGIGVEASRRFVRETCREMGWPLVEIRAKEDCGQDYDEIVLAHGFPGPAMHGRMYQRLKERCVEKLVRDHKKHRLDRILIATGIYHEESIIRMGYGDRVINRKGAQVWVNPLYWWPKDRIRKYVDDAGIPRNPVSQTLGYSGECLCGAFAHPGEKALIRIVEPETAERLEDLERRVRAAGHDWGWEDRGPNVRKPTRLDALDMPFCRGCNKTFFDEAAQ